MKARGREEAGDRVIERVAASGAIEARWRGRERERWGIER